MLSSRWHHRSRLMCTAHVCDLESKIRSCTPRNLSLHGGGEGITLLMTIIRLNAYNLSLVFFLDIVTSISKKLVRCKYLHNHKSTSICPTSSLSGVFVNLSSVNLSRRREISARSSSITFALSICIIKK